MTPADRLRAAARFMRRESEKLTRAGDTAARVMPSSESLFREQAQHALLAALALEVEAAVLACNATGDDVDAICIAAARFGKASAALDAALATDTPAAREETQG